MEYSIQAAHVDAIERYQHGNKLLLSLDDMKIACEVGLDDITTAYLIELLLEYPNHTFENDCLLYDRPMTEKEKQKKIAHHNLYIKSAVEMLQRDIDRSSDYKLQIKGYLERHNIEIKELLFW